MVRQQESSQTSLLAHLDSILVVVGRPTEGQRKDARPTHSEPVQEEFVVDDLPFLLSCRQRGHDVVVECMIAVRDIGIIDELGRVGEFRHESVEEVP